MVDITAALNLPEAETSDGSLDDLASLVSQANLIPALLDSDPDMQSDLDMLASELVRGYELDLQSCTEFFAEQEEWFKTALQLRDTKTFPWADASNVKVPTMLVASQQFGARAYPALIPGNNIVSHKIVGKDEANERDDAGRRLAKYLNYQLFYQIDGWNEGMDTMLNSTLPMVGTVFKHVYFDDLNNKPAVDVLKYNELVINYTAKDMDSAYRKTRLLEYTQNEIEERIRADLFIEHEYGMGYSSGGGENRTFSDKVNRLTPPTTEQDKSSVDCYYEIHSWADFDHDGYEEPYIFTIHKNSKKIVRIKARFDETGVEMNTRGEIKRIKPTRHFIRYGFLPNPMSNIYYLGFNMLLGPLTESINTIINQTIDNQTLATSGGGFINSSAGIKAGTVELSLGEFKQIKTNVDDIRKAIWQPQWQAPSAILFQLLQYLTGQAENISTVKDIMLGENPGQNQKATTTLAVLEEGRKTFSSIYQRIYAVLEAEVQEIRRIDALFITEQEYFEVLDDKSVESIAAQDFKANVNIHLVADKKLSTESVRLTKAQSLIEMQPMGLNRKEVLRRALEAQEQPNIPALMAPDDDGPSMEQQIAMKDMELREREVVVKEKELILKALELEEKASHNHDTLRLEAAQGIIEGLSKVQKSMVDKAKVHNDRQKQQQSSTTGE